MRSPAPRARARAARFALVLVALLTAAAPVLAAPPDGTLAIGVHVTLVSRWLDPSLAIDRNAINQSEMLGLGKPAEDLKLK